MATSAPISVLPLPFKPQIPVTPPPDCQSFPSQTSSALSPQRLRAFNQEAFGVMETKVEAAPATTTATTTVKTATTSATTAEATSAAMTAQMPGSVCQGHDLHSGKADLGTGPLDPRYLAMVSRIAAYYQQRCQAVSNYQHQRCQAWANMQRQKCQEMTQAAMLVVAWYVRDRIQRRRKRQKRQFRRGLSERTAGAGGSGPGGVSKAKKNESVRKWVSQIPEGALSPNSVTALAKPSDKEELEFSMDVEPPPDKDAKLFAVADNLIKSQLARIDVPLMGAISFDEESDSETESEDEELNRWRQQDDDQDVKLKTSDHKVHVAGPEEQEQEDYDDDDEDDDEDYSYEDEDMDDYDDENASGLVQKGTGSAKPTESLLPS